MEDRNNKGQFVKGNPGRPKGSVVQMKLKEQLTDFVHCSLPTIIEDYNEAKTPRERRQIIFEILPYVLPKLKTTDEAGMFGSLSDEDLSRIVESLKQHYESRKQ